jgi:hypothetical protein
MDEVNDIPKYFLLIIVFSAIVSIVLYYAIRDRVLRHGISPENTNDLTDEKKAQNDTLDKVARTNRMYLYIFSIILPIIGILFYIKNEYLNATINAAWYIAVFLGIMLAGFVLITLYNYLPNDSNTYILVNFLIFILVAMILFVGLSIIYNMGNDYFSKQTGMTAFYIQMLFYIPCLIIDFVKYAFKDFSTTPNIVFVLFVAEILLVLVYIYGPDVSNMMVLENSRILLPDYRQLNTFNTIAQATIFQVKPPAIDVSTTTFGENNGDDSPDCVDIHNINLYDTDLQDKDLPNSPRKPLLNGITDPVYVSKGYDDPNNNTCKYNPYMVVDPYVAVKCLRIKLDDLKDPSVYGSQSMYDMVKGKIKTNLDDKLIQSEKTLYNLNYAISFWTFLNYKPEIFQSPHEMVILNYSNPANDYKGAGGNPKITFLNDEYNVYFTNHSKCVSKHTYVSDCMYKVRLQNQKWNNFVLNYYSTHVDLFINGILEKTYKFSDNAPIYSNSDQINVGELNGAYGSICNVIYYTVPLTKPQIASYYNILSMRNPPVLKL